MTRKALAPTDPPEVTQRAAQITAQAHTQYWLVATAADLDALCRGRVTADLRGQAVVLLHRTAGETDREYLARLEDLQMQACRRSGAR